MAKVICTIYGRFRDRTTGVEFRPELVDGRYVGVATVDDPAALDRFRGREGFEIVGEEKTSEPNSKGNGEKSRKSRQKTASKAPDEGKGEKGDAGDGEATEE